MWCYGLMDKVNVLFAINMWCSYQNFSWGEICRNDPTELVMGGDSSNGGPRGSVKGGSFDERSPCSMTLIYPST